MIETFKLRDGRSLDVYIGGDPKGFPLVMHHGTPSDATTFAGWDADCRARDLRLVCASRPGYATSTRLKGRAVAQAAADTAELLDKLGHGNFVTAGWSGGGPHALACGALLADRCNAVATLAGVGPFGRQDLDFLAGMGPENIDEFGEAVKGEPALREWMAKNGEALKTITGPALADAFGGLIPQVDRDVLVGGFAEEMAAVMRRALAHGFDGWIDDDIAFTKDWGFAPESIKVPVMVWQGNLDLMVPFAHGRWLAKTIPGAQAKLVPGHGHISLVTRYRPGILEGLHPYARATKGRP